MTVPPNRVFLDTNIYIIGAAQGDTPEAAVLRWVGFESSAPSAEVVVSNVLIEQIRRVGRRVGGKDWAGQLLARIWQELRVVYVVVPAGGLSHKAPGPIPREDVGVYLTARMGEAECFVSANRELVRVLAERTGTFECLSPSDFMAKYVDTP